MGWNYWQVKPAGADVWTTLDSLKVASTAKSAKDLGF